MRSTQIAALFAAAAVFTSACSSAPPPAGTYNDARIMRGDRVGQVTLGMPLSQLLRAKGTPLKTAPIEGTAATSYTFDGLTVGAHDEVYMIVATGERFTTATGVGPGVEQIFARAQFGPPDCVVTGGPLTKYDYGDIRFDVDNETGRVTQGVVREDTGTCG